MNCLLKRSTLGYARTVRRCFTFTSAHPKSTCQLVSSLSRGHDCSSKETHNIKWPLRIKQKTAHRYYSTEQNTEQSTTESTVNDEEVSKFESFAKSWWSDSGNASALHTLNYLRVPFIRDGLLQQDGHHNLADTTAEPLKGYKLLDIGCGGGLLSEALARLGADVVGVDAVEESIKTAQWHSAQDKTFQDRLQYKCCLVEDMTSEFCEHFDGVVCSEVIEHVENQSHFVFCCSELVKPGGSIFFTTISKTIPAYLLAVLAAERLVGIVPVGTHDYSKFISPQDLQMMLQNNGFQTRLIHGMTLNPLSQRWCWIRNSDVNYALHAVKTTPS